MRPPDRWTEADAIAHAQRHGLALDPALTLPAKARTMDPETPEGVLLARVRTLAKAHAFETFHVFDSRKSDVGFPDLTLVKPGRLIFTELKSQQGKLTPEQTIWLDLLRHSVPGVEVYEWRPRDMPAIERILTRRPL